jgi:predicted DNA-binding transcriptional regulator YafY
MRADRLLSLVMLLQTRGRMTASELARELEVSERTIYRDVIALGSSGIPVYTDRGPGGGIALLDSYRTSLTGLNEDETAALFMVSIPAPLEALGVGSKLRAALLKLSAALPESRREAEIRSRQRIHLDSVPWHQGQKPLPYLALLQQAVWQAQWLDLTIEASFSAQIQAIVEPLGLVAKANTWYLVFRRDGALRVIPVRRVLKAELQPETFDRPDEFDLVAFWYHWMEENEAYHTRYPVLVKVAPELIPFLTRHFNDTLVEQVESADAEDCDGWRVFRIYFESLEAARGRLLAFGRAVEVLEPLPLRLSLVDFAEQVVDFYRCKR